MRLELLFLSMLAATALAMLIDSARRAGPSDVDDAGAAASPSATLELLERARARLDEHPPRVLIEVGGAAVLAAACASLLDDPAVELAAILAAAGVGLGAPGLRWLAEVRRQRRALEARIASLRARLSSSGARPPFSRGAAPLPRA